MKKGESYILLKRENYKTGHTSKHDSPIQMVLEGVIPGKKRRGSPRTNFISQTREELSLKYVDIKKKIDDGEKWRRTVG